MGHRARGHPRAARDPEPPRARAGGARDEQRGEGGARRGRPGGTPALRRRRHARRRGGGALVGLPRCGAVATSDAEAALAADAACVSYMGATDFRLQAALDDMCRILAKGLDLVMTSFVPLIFPPALPESIGRRLPAARRAGGTT